MDDFFCCRILNNIIIDNKVVYLRFLVKFVKFPNGYFFEASTSFRWTLFKSCNTRAFLKNFRILSKELADGFLSVRSCEVSLYM